MEESKSIIEAWRPVRAFGGDYLASNLGRVRSLSRMSYGEVYMIPERILRSSVNKKTGYETVNLYKGGKCARYYVHRLVAETFLENPSGFTDVNHKDGDKQNNKLSNLEWVTRSENKIHSFRTGIAKTTKGEQNWKAKLTTTHILTIRQLWNSGKYTRHRLGEIFSVETPTITNIINKKSWKHVA